MPPLWGESRGLGPSVSREPSATPVDTSITLRVLSGAVGDWQRAWLYADPKSPRPTAVAFDYRALRGRRLRVRLDDPRRATLAEGEFAAGRLVCLHLRARPGAEITTTDVKSPSIVADVRRCADAARTIQAGRLVGVRHVELGPEVGRMLTVRPGEVRVGQRRRRGQERDQLLRAVAEGYRALTRDEPVRQVRAALTTRLAGLGYLYDPGHVGRLIMQARAAGLLGPPLRGRAGEAAPPPPKRSREEAQ